MEDENYFLVPCGGTGATEGHDPWGSCGRCAARGGARMVATGVTPAGSYENPWIIFPSVVASDHLFHPVILRLRLFSWEFCSVGLFWWASFLFSRRTSAGRSWVGGEYLGSWKRKSTLELGSSRVNQVVAGGTWTMGKASAVVSLRAKTDTDIVWKPGKSLGRL